MKLADAEQVARNVVGLMRPFCDRIEIAGSVRRGVAEVKDIEIVCIPRWQEQQKGGSFLAGDVQSVNLLHQAVAPSRGIRWIKPGVPGIEPWPIKPEGRYWRGLISK